MQVQKSIQTTKYEEQMKTKRNIGTSNVKLSFSFEDEAIEGVSTGTQDSNAMVGGTDAVDVSDDEFFDGLERDMQEVFQGSRVPWVALTISNNGEI